MDEILKDPSIPDQQKVTEHVEMMNEYQLMMAKYRFKEGGAQPLQIQKNSTPQGKNTMESESGPTQNIPPEIEEEEKDGIDEA